MVPTFALVDAGPYRVEGPLGAGGMGKVVVRQPLAQTCELVGQATVVDRAADARDDAADDGGIDMRCDGHLLGCRGAQARLQGLLLVGAERRGGRNLRLQHVLFVEHAFVKHRGDVRQEVEAVALRQQRQQLRHRRGHGRAFDEGLDDGALGARWDAGAGEHRLEVGLIGKQPRDRGQLFIDANTTGGIGYVEERAGVA